MFLIRLAFWLSLLVLVLPTDPRQQEKLVAATSQTVHRIATFCDRNAAICERGGEYWALFKQKLEFGAQLAFDLASTHLLTGSADATQATGSISAPAAVRSDRARSSLPVTETGTEPRNRPPKSGG